MMMTLSPSIPTHSQIHIKKTVALHTRTHINPPSRTTKKKDAEELLQLLVNLIADELGSPGPGPSDRSNKPPTVAPSPPSSTTTTRAAAAAATKPLSSGLRDPLSLLLRRRRLPPGPLATTKGSGSSMSSSGSTQEEKVAANGSTSPTTTAPAAAAAAAAARAASTPFRNPLSGWWASTLQCCGCGHRRPVQNSAFIDVQLTLPEAQAILRGQGKPGPVRYASLLAEGKEKGADGLEGPCHLMDCLR